MAKSYKYKNVHSGVGEITFEFITDSFITFQIILRGKKPENNVYIFETSLINDKPTLRFPRDPKIEHTVVKIFKEIFKYQSDLNLLFCCYNEDGRGNQRRILFERWFSSYNGKMLEKYYCNHFSKDVSDAFIITMKNNPLKKHLINQFREIGILFT